MGAHRLPSNVHELSGAYKRNPQRRNDGEPRPDNREVVPPFKLTKAAAEVWERLAPDLRKKRVLTHWDADLFAEFCEAVVILRSKRRGAKHKAVVGGPSPMSEYKAAVHIVTTLGSRFGLSPSDRTKIVVGGGQADPTDDLLS